MTILKVNQRGVITLPKKMRDALGIKVGGILGVREEKGTLILEPHTSARDAVLEDIRAGLAEIQRGEFIEFGSVNELHTRAKRYAD